MLKFIGIGAQKSGTSWLYEVLARHPSVRFPGGKEVHFWDAHRSKGIAWYANLFGDAGQCAGDITPAYAILPAEVIREVHAHFPDVALIYLMRNPIERAWSSARMALARAEMQFAEASEQWFIDHFRSAGSLARGDYAQCLKNWLACYPREQLLIARHEALIDDPLALANRVLAHIGLDAGFAETARQELARPVFAGRHQPLPASLAAVLLELYAGKIDALGELLDEDFSAWKRIGP